MKIFVLAFALAAAAFAQSVTVSLNGTVSDDGLPSNTLTTTWTRVSGPGAVTFSAPNAAVTQATMTVPGTYVLRLSASDGALSSFDDVTVTITVPNKPPVVNAGPDINAVMMSSVSLNGTVADDGKPAGTVTAKWSRVSGPANGRVTFQDPTKPATLVSFDRQGTYVLQLSASDSQHASTDRVQVGVRKR